MRASLSWEALNPLRAGITAGTLRTGQALSTGGALDAYRAIGTGGTGWADEALVALCAGETDSTLWTSGASRTLCREDTPAAGGDVRCVSVVGGGQRGVGDALPEDDVAESVVGGGGVGAAVDEAGGALRAGGASCACDALRAGGPGGALGSDAAGRASGAGDALRTGLSGGEQAPGGGDDAGGVAVIRGEERDEGGAEVLDDVTEGVVGGRGISPLVGEGLLDAGGDCGGAGSILAGGGEQTPEGGGRGRGCCLCC